MKNLSRSISLAVLSSVSLLSGLAGDVVETTDGARLTGDIVQILDNKIILETPYAGKIEIDQSRVVRFSTDEPIAVRLESGTIMAAEVVTTPEGEMALENADGRVVTSADKVAAAWAPSGRDPQVVLREAELEGQLRKWSYEAGVDISGKSGNSDESTIGVQAAARLEGPRDRLRFYVSIDKAEQNDIETSAEYIGGVSYTNFFTEKWGWFIREEIEVDEFENIDFRSTSAGGITHRLFNHPDHSLELRGGLSYRFEDYSDATPSEEYPGLELGLLYHWQFASWGDLNTEIVYLPAFEDFGNYRLTHKSNVDIPLARSDKWKLRAGLVNEYNSEPAPTARSTDTTYFLSLLLSWK